jgi:carbamoyl-phosphate synthase large subunit
MKMKLRKIKVLITGAGAPGAPGIIKSLRLNREREIHIIGVDANLQESVGNGLVDSAYEIPLANSRDFIPQLLSICEAEKIDVIIPLVTNELFVFAQNKSIFEKAGIKILVSDYESLQVANNKFSLMVYCKKINVPAPDFKVVKTLEEFENALKDLGYPERKLCFKPPLSNGLRGFRILSDSTDRMHNLMNEKPNNVYISVSEFRQIALESNYFPELLVMEYLPGEEYSIDALGDGQKCIQVIPRTREKIKMGISFVGSTCYDQELIHYSKAIIENLKLFGNIGFQFRRDRNNIPKIIESNPRVQGTIVLCTAAGYNMVYNAVKIALGEAPLESEVKWGTKMVRFWEELYFSPDKQAFSLQ